MAAAELTLRLAPPGEWLGVVRAGGQRHLGGCGDACAGTDARVVRW